MGDCFRCLSQQMIMLGQEPRQTTSNIGHLNKPSITALVHGLNRHYYSIAINYRKNDLEQKMLLNFGKKPLDGCGTEAEMGKNDNGDDVVIFKNKIRNGAYSSTQGGQDTHGGIALDAVVDFTVQCSYLATYESNSLEMEAEQSALADKVNENAGDIFNVEVEFMNLVAAAETAERGGFNPNTGTGQVTSVTLTDTEGNTFASAAATGHSVQVGDTAYA